MSGHMHIDNYGKAQMKRLGIERADIEARIPDGVTLIVRGDYVRIPGGVSAYRWTVRSIGGGKDIVPFSKESARTVDLGFSLEFHLSAARGWAMEREGQRAS